jgi:two-component system OmpR family sensor kinase
VKRLRGRLFLALAATALLCTVLTVVVATVVLHRQAERRREQTLARLADTVATTSPDAGLQVLRVAATGGVRKLGTVGRERVLSQVPASGDGSGRLKLRGREVDYAARDTAAGRVIVLGATGKLAHNGPPPGRTVLLAGLAGLLVALVLSLFVARRLTRPLRELSAGAGRVATGEPGVRVAVRSDDEIGQLAAAFNTMAAELELARDAERAFLLSVSHEFKTPLSAVRGYAEAIADGTVDAHHGAAVIGEESLHIERLVADLLDLARVRTTDFTVRREPLDLARVAAGAVERHAIRARELGVVLTDESLSRAPGIGDPDRALQAVSNLVENALRVVPEGGRVTVRAVPGLVAVSDDGPGIRAEHAEHAFDRFYLRDRYRGRRSVGTGLGLALVRELAHAMGGSVQLVRAGHETVFELRLDGGGPAPHTAPAPAAAVAT